MSFIVVHLLLVLVLPALVLLLLIVSAPFPIFSVIVFRMFILWVTFQF